MEITSLSQLIKIIRYERKRYNLRVFDYLTFAPKASIFKYIKLLRMCEFFKKRGGIYKAFFVLTRIRKNALGKKLGIEIGEFACGKGLLIYHAGSIVINGASSIGDNLKLHGANCIGNSGKTKECPSIGNDVEIGYGGTVIGAVKIGNNIKIGSNATVVKDCLIDGATLIGTPAIPIDK